MEYFGDNVFLVGLDEYHYKFENKIIRHNCYEKMDIADAQHYTILHGLKSGKCLVCYIGGNVWMKCNHINDKKEGKCLKYNREGNITEKCNYINGKLEGEYLYYWNDGNIQEKCNYINGEKEGEYSKYYRNGNVRSTRNYKNGRLHGERLKYWNGELCTVEYYDDIKIGSINLSNTEAVEYFKKILEHY